MPTNTYVALATTTVATATPTVTFSSIPSGYTDLVVVVNGGLSATTQSFRFQVGNGTIDTGNNYSYTYMAGNGSSASSSRVANTSGFNAYHVAGQSDTNIKNNVILHYQNYSNTTTNKTILCRGNSDLETAATVALWRSTAAINTILVGTTSGNLVAGTTISIYGIAAVPQLVAKATGGTIYYGADGYVYHKFTSNGTFTPSTSLSCDILVAAGGGGGGSNGGGGGGAGGVITATSSSFAATGHTVTIGAGGSAGVNGSNTVLGSNTAIGGAKGAPLNQAGTLGGSGGGGGMSAGASVTGGAGTSGQGFAGGNGSSTYSSSTGGGGGGGGAGGVGTNATNTNPMLGRGGNGVSGLSVSFVDSMGLITSSGQASGSNYYFSGGGSGGPSGHSVTSYGGLGGGANFNASGTANTGGGGGGGQAYGSDSPGAGGSGIVIVRYLG